MRLEVRKQNAKNDLVVFEDKLQQAMYTRFL